VKGQDHEGGCSKRDAAEVGEDRSSGGYAMATFKVNRQKKTPGASDGTPSGVVGMEVPGGSA